MIELPRLESERLVIRAPVEADIEVMPRVFSDPDIHAYTRSFPYPYTREDAVEALARFERLREAGEAVTWFVTLRESGQLIGSIGFLNIKARDEAEFGYVVGRVWWGKGYATEACVALLDYGFGTLGFSELCAHAMVRNPASSRVLEKIGMRSVGVLKDLCEKDGEHFDAEGFVLSCNEWKAQQA